MVKRDFTGRYRGSFLGVAWSLFNPLLMLAIYTFVFSVAFNARWGGGGDDKASFAIVLFAGMIVHALLAECLTRAPTLIVSHANYVKKVVFPLEVLPVVVLASALLHFAVTCWCSLRHACSFLMACPWLPFGLHRSAATCPCLALGTSWMLASLGVYLRDLYQGIGMIVTVLLFVSPIFYPVEALPQQYRWIVELNPLTMPITQLRNVVIWGRGIDWSEWWLGFAVALAVFAQASGGSSARGRGFARCL